MMAPMADGRRRRRRRVVRRADRPLDLVGTVVFVVTAVLAAVVFTTAVAVGRRGHGAGRCSPIGVFAFLWAYCNAVQRSRTDEISVAQLYFLLGPPTPPRVRRAMLATLLAQVVDRGRHDVRPARRSRRQPGSSLAVGFLVPMLGFGLNGLWAACHGTFPARVERADVEATSADDGRRHRAE